MSVPFSKNDNIVKLKYFFLNAKKSSNDSPISTFFEQTAQHTSRHVIVKYDAPNSNIGLQNLHKRVNKRMKHRRYFRDEEGHLLFYPQKQRSTNQPKHGLSVVLKRFRARQENYPGILAYCFPEFMRPDDAIGKRALGGLNDQSLANPHILSRGCTDYLKFIKPVYVAITRLPRYASHLG